MQTLLYNPLLRLIGWLWWLPALILLLAWGAAGEAGLRTAAGIGGVGLAFLAGAAGAMTLHGSLAVGLRRFRRHRAKTRFLCPECLRFAPVCSACPGCGKPLPEAIAATQNLYLQDCPHCDYALFDKQTPLLKACCPHCYSQDDPDRWHGYRVRVVATLSSEDYVRCGQTAGGAKARRGEEMTWIEENGAILVILNRAAFPLPSVVKTDHMLHHLDALWINGLDTDPLALGKAVDRLLRTTGKRNLPLWVGQKRVDPAVMQMLSARFDRIVLNAAPREAVSTQQEADATFARHSATDSSQEAVTITTRSR